MIQLAVIFISFPFPASDSQKITENGIITQMRAEWILPEDKKLEVTLKELKQDKYLTVSRTTKPSYHRIARKENKLNLNGSFLGFHEIGRNME